MQPGDIAPHQFDSLQPIREMGARFIFYVGESTTDGASVESEVMADLDYPNTSCTTRIHGTEGRESYQLGIG